MNGAGRRSRRAAAPSRRACAEVTERRYGAAEDAAASRQTRRRSLRSRPVPGCRALQGRGNLSEGTAASKGLGGEGVRSESIPGPFRGAGWEERRALRREGGRRRRDGPFPRGGMRAQRIHWAGTGAIRRHARGRRREAAGPRSHRRRGASGRGDGGPVAGQGREPVQPCGMNGN